MLNKLLQSIGIGSARVDTVLASRTCMPGGSVKGEVHIYGGNAPQDIETIYLSLMTSYEIEVDDSRIRRSVELTRVHLSDRFTVQTSQELVMPFEIHVPLNAPVTIGRSEVWIQTGLDIKSAMDPQDRDLLDVTPHPLVSAFISAAERIGFRLYQVDCEKTAYRYADNALPFVQKFEFKPYGGEFRSRLDELEAVFQINENGATAILQVDRRVRGFASMLSESMGLDESYVKFSYSQSDIAQLEHLLANAIRRYC